MNSRRSPSITRLPEATLADADLARFPSRLRIWWRRRQLWRAKRSLLHIGPRAHRVALGAWNYFVPDLQLKLAHVVHSHIRCLSPRAADYDWARTAAPDTPWGRYTAAEWAAAYATSARRRAAENFIAMQRLHAAGLGPEPFGFCLISRYRSPFDPQGGENVGIFVQNIHHLPPKADATRQQIEAAGVSVDNILSCVRQQIRGYVSDLNSVCGVKPIEAEEEIALILERFETETAQPMG